MVTVIRVTPSEAAAALNAASCSSGEADSIIQQANEITPHSRNVNNDENRGGKKRDLPSEDAVGGKDTKSKRQKTDKFVLDLNNVPPQLPIPKRKGSIIEEGKSKYTGVSFNKATKKWKAQIMIDGKKCYIGTYESEEEAAIDYARAVFKYNGQEALDKMRERKSSGSGPAIDLSDVPPQQPVPKIKGRIKEGASKYTGVTFNKRTKKWKGEISIDGKQRHIGYYNNEEEAAIDYARAVFKYQGQEALDKVRERNSDKEKKKRQKQKANGFVFDLSGVPPQLPIPKTKGRMKEGASKYAGVTFDKAASKWKAQIRIDGKLRHIAYYENEEETAADYARAVFKYKGEGMKKAEQRGELHTA